MILWPIDRSTRQRGQLRLAEPDCVILGGGVHCGARRREVPVVRGPGVWAHHTPPAGHAGGNHSEVPRWRPHPWPGLPNHRHGCERQGLQQTRGDQCCASQGQSLITGIFFFYPVSKVIYLQLLTNHIYWRPAMGPEQDSSDIYGHDILLVRWIYIPEARGEPLVSASPTQFPVDWFRSRSFQ